MLASEDVKMTSKAITAVVLTGSGDLPVPLYTTVYNFTHLSLLKYCHHSIHNAKLVLAFLQSAIFILCPHYCTHLSIHLCIHPFFLSASLILSISSYSYSFLSNLFIHMSFCVGLLLYLPIFMSFLPSGPISVLLSYYTTICITDSFWLLVRAM